MAYATVVDVEVSLGRPAASEAERLQIAQWIQDAETLIAARLGDLSALDPQALAYVVREAAILKLRNPEGYTSESIDDYTYRWGTGSGRVAILDEWWDLLTGPSQGAAFTITPYGEPDSVEPDLWVSTTDWQV